MPGFLGLDIQTKPAWGLGVDPDEPIARGLYAYWPLAEGMGVFAGDVKGGNNLTLNGTTSWGPGPDGYAISIPGNATSYLQTSQNIFDPLTNDLTAALWFNAAATGTQQTLLQQLDGTGTGRNWLFITTTRQLATSIGGVNTVSATNLITAGNWYRAMVTTLGTTITLYLNGVQVATSSHAAEANIAELRLGVSKTGGNIFTGQFGKGGIPLWNRALTAGEALRDYQEQSCLLLGPAVRRFYTVPSAAAFHTWFIGRGSALGGGML